MVSTSDHVRRKQMMKAISRARLTATTAKRSRCFFVFYSLANRICKSILVFDCFVFVFKFLQDNYTKALGRGMEHLCKWKYVSCLVYNQEITAMEMTMFRDVIWTLRKIYDTLSKAAHVPSGKDSRCRTSYSSQRRWAKGRTSSSAITVQAISAVKEILDKSRQFGNQNSMLTALKNKIG